MHWRKLGLIIRPAGLTSWMVSHATSPFVLERSNGEFRVFFSTRDGENRAQLGFVDINLKTPKDVIRFSQEPVLSFGPFGHFDDHGVYGRCLVRRGDELLLYYLGWNPGRAPLFYSAIGLAISKDEGTSFHKTSPAPLLERSPVDPWCVLLPYVLEDKGLLRMWYASGLGWVEKDGRMRSQYDIKYAWSRDGMLWHREGLVCLPLLDGETNLAHPCVHHDGARYHMWFSREGLTDYRIGYAISSDGLSWERRDEEGGLDVSADGPDSQMTCQPCVFSWEGRRYMFYNGDDYGRKGICLAVAEA